MTRAARLDSESVEARPPHRDLEPTLLTVAIVLIVAIPSKLIFSPLGSAGTPADVLGLIMLVVWSIRRVMTRRRAGCVNPVVTAMLIFFAAVLASYVAAATRPISAIEMSAADRGLLISAAWLGMMLIAADGIRTLAGLDVVLHRLVIAGGALASLGLVQFATKMALVNYIQIPGLVDNADLDQLGQRGSLTRPSGTAIHPIEFGAVLTMILPFALHYALHDQHRSLIRRWYPVAAIAAAIPISISRSAILSAIVVLLFMLPMWSVGLRRRAYAAIIGLSAVLYLTVPGLLGEITGLFLGISEDSSAQSRTDSYRLAFEFIGRSPIFGRGVRTFLPSYRILDNQLLGTAIEMGLVGLAALLGLLLTSTLTALRTRRRTEDDTVWHLGRAVAASIASAGCSLALFDGFSFPMAASTLFLVIGCGGALVRLTRNRVTSIPC